MFAVTFAPMEGRKEGRKEGRERGEQHFTSVNCEMAPPLK